MRLIFPLARIKSFFGIASMSDTERLEAALSNLRQPEADALQVLQQLVAALRPEDGDFVACRERYESMLVCLENDADLLAAFRQHLTHFVTSRRALRLSST